MSVIRWRFLEPESNEEVILPLNPNKMSSPYANRTLEFAWGSHGGEGLGRPRIFAPTPPNPLEWNFGGVILVKSHYDLLLEWTKWLKLLRVTDHLGRTFEIIIQRFDPVERRRSADKEWRCDYTMTCLVLKDLANVPDTIDYVDDDVTELSGTAVESDDAVGGNVLVDGVVIYSGGTAVEDDSAVGGLGAVASSGERSYLLQPYNSDSIWNTPIGDNADEKPANMPTNYNHAGKITIDEMHLGLNPSAPVRPISNGVMRNGINVGPPPSANQIPAGSTARIPNDLLHDSSLNGIAGVLHGTDNTKAWTGLPLYRPTTASNPQIYGTGSGYPTGIRGLDDLTGDGRKGGHGGGQCGGIGGTIRTWEYDQALADDYLINHRLALNVHGVTCLSQANRGLGAGLSGPGWRWPAYKADSNFNTPGANNHYGRTSPAGVVMGSLLALPLGYDLDGITDPLVYSIGWALLNFGCHIVDVTGYTQRYAFSVEANRESAWLARPVSTFHQALMSLIVDLVLIDDCTPTNPGGAGSPRVDPPPPLDV